MPTNAQIKDALDALGAHQLAAHECFGGAAAVLRDGEPVCETYFGDDRFSNRALFRLASMTKLFTAAAMMKLCEDRGLALDTPVSAYLHAFAHLKIGVLTADGSAYLKPSERAAAARDAGADLLLSIQKKPTGVAYVYLEPFMEIEKYYGVIRKFHEAGVHQHMYTNGTLATEENLRALGEAGLDELRFNLGASGCADRVIENIAMAKKYIRYVGIETPMTPELYETFMKKKDKILATGFDFMNCAELHLNPNNIDNYEGENLYMARQGYISPIWSRDLTLSLMETAVRENWEPLIHDCSNRKKFARDLNLRAHEGGWFGASSYGSEFPRIPYAAFLPTLRDAELQFAEEEPMPVGYRPGDIVL